jgi:xanthine dehydrogenase YagR molybdenum-binding subunit
VTIEARYLLPRQQHNPMEPHATIARWDGYRLTLWDKTQSVVTVRDDLAAIFGLAPEQVHVISPFVGGAFGTTLRAWPHVTLAALAAREVGRAVKLVLTRHQMYAGTGYRPATSQRIALGATRAGRLTAIDLEGVAETSRYEEYLDLIEPARFLYSCPNVATRYRLAHLDVHTPIFMRGPGFASGIVALECAMDEALRIRERVRDLCPNKGAYGRTGLIARLQSCCVSSRVRAHGILLPRRDRYSLSRFGRLSDKVASGMKVAAPSSRAWQRAT